MKKSREINVFSISFIDTFCCALGAMILVFVINSQILHDSVRSAVEKYRIKSKEAEQERDNAVQSRNLARVSRDQANKARNDAILARNRAEKAEREALKARELAIIAKKEALKQKETAEEMSRKAKMMKEKAYLAKEEVDKSKSELRKLYERLKVKNESLKSINQTLRNMIKEREKKDKRIKDLMDKYGSLQKAYDDLESKKDKLASAISKLEKDKKELKLEKSRLEDWYKEIKNKADSLRGQNEEMSDENKNLSERLNKKQEVLREKEKIIKSKEEIIKKREKDILAKERVINSIRKQLEKKGDLSLFGIKLTYRRIVFLFDKSGSIKNNWQNVIINTCKEILEKCEVDEFAIVAFSSRMAFFPGRKGLMIGGSEKNKEKAVGWLNNRVIFGGFTRVDIALKIAYENYGDLDAIFLITDGLPYEKGYKTEDLQKNITKYIKKKVSEGIKTKIITISIGYPRAAAQQYALIYDYLHKISDLTGGQYLGR